MKFSALHRATAATCAIICLIASAAARGSDALTAPVYDYTNAPVDSSAPADIIIYNARVVTVDSKFSIAKDIAIRGDKIAAVGNWKVEKLRGPNTRMLDAKGATILPGLYDGDVHSCKAAISEIHGARPALNSIAAAQDYIRKQAAAKSFGSWIILEGLYPTRLAEGRLPTKAELDSVAPKNPVLWDCGALAVVNGKALEFSGIDKDTANPPGGEIVRSRKNYQPTGLLRNATSVLKLPLAARPPARQQVREALKNLYRHYNEQGVTSIDEQQAAPATVDLLRDLSKAGELTVRVNCARSMDNLGANEDEAITNLDAMTNAAPDKAPYGPTGAGDDWVRIGPLTVVLDGSLLDGTAYLRYPWGIGPTYRITEPAYLGERHCDTAILGVVYEEASQRGWQLAAECTGDAAMDAILNVYQRIQFQQDIHKRRFFVTHADFQGDQDWEKCRRLGIAASVQPAWLYKDGASLRKTLGEKHMTHFLPLKTWFERGLVVGGGSHHTGGLDSLGSDNPWNPWLGLWITLARQTEQGQPLNAEQKLTREEAIRLYTINNCYLHSEESKKGSLEPGKLADLIMVDSDILRCPVDEIRKTKVLMTIVGGKVVWEALPKQAVLAARN